MFSLIDQNNNADDYFNVAYDKAPVEDRSKYAGGAVIEAKPAPPAPNGVNSSRPAPNGVKSSRPAPNGVKSSRPAPNGVKSSKPVPGKSHRKIRCSKPATAHTQINSTDVRTKDKSPCAVEYSIIWLAIVFLILFASQPVK
jgi:hypothetical protein